MTPHRWLLDLQATQSQAHADRGVARYVKDHTRALLRRGVGDALLLNPHLPFPRNLDQDLLGSPLLHWNTQSVVRRVAESVDGPIAFHLMSPFELSLRGEGDLPPHLLRGEIPVAVTLYDLIPLVLADRYLTDERLAARYRARAEQLHHVDLVLTISEHTRRDAIRLLDLDPAKVVNIGGGVSAYFRPEQPGDAAAVTIARHVPAVTKAFVYAVLGADPRKNAERLFRAWASTPVRDSHQLVVTCSLDAATQTAWEAELESLGLGPDTVVLTGWIPEEALRALYQRTELVVMPSLYEGFGFPIAEAIACGAPVVTSSASSLPEVLDWPDAAFDPLDEGGMAALLTRGVEDESFNAELRRRGADRAPSLTWDAVADRTLAAYGLLPEPTVARTDLPVRLALVGPMPPAASGIADYNARLLGPLAARADVDVFTTSPRPADLPAGVRWLPPRSFQETCSPWSYDAAVYTVGNSDHHHDTYDLAQEFPGILWLHDVRIPGLYLTYSETRFDDDAFLRERLLRQYRRRLPLHLMYGDVRRTSGEFVEFGLGMAKELVDQSRAVVVSSELARRLLTLDQQPDGRMPPTHVVPHAALPPWGDDTRRRSPDRPLLACFGIVAPVKGPELAIATLAALAESGVDGELALVGHVDDGYRSHLEAVAAAAGVSDRLTLTGRLDRAEYERWLAEATVGLQLRLSTNGEMSGGIFDCLAAGLPTVTNLPSSDELPDGVVAIVPWDVDGAGLASHVRALLEAPDRLAALGDAGRSFSATWGYADVAERLVAIARSLPA